MFDPFEQFKIETGKEAEMSEKKSKFHSLGMTSKWSKFQFPKAPKVLMIMNWVMVQRSV